MNDLSPANKYNLTMFAIKRFGTDQLPLLDSRPSFPALAPVRVEVARTEPERTFTAYDLDAMRRHSQEMSTMGIGPSLEDQRRQKQQLYREFVVLTLIAIGATVGTLILLWAVVSIIRQAIG